MPKSTPLSPGQVAYTAYQAVLPERLYFPAPAWDSMQEPWQRAWAAAAQAVMTARHHGATTCPVCGTHDVTSPRPVGLTADGDVHRDMCCEECAAMWVNVYTFAHVRDVERQEDTPHA